MSLYSASCKIAKYVAEEAELSSDRVDSVRYGLEIILGTMIKVAVLLTLAYLLGTLPQVIIALVCGSLLRLVSGGAHCTSYLRCLSFGLVVYLSAGMIALNMEKLLAPGQLAMILWPCFLAMALCACLWAPAEVPYKTIYYKERIFFKSLTLVFLTVFFSTVFLSLGHIKLSYIMAGLLALVAQTLSFTPLGYLVIGKIDNSLSYIAARKGGGLNNEKI